MSSVGGYPILKEGDTNNGLFRRRSDCEAETFCGCAIVDAIVEVCVAGPEIYYVTMEKENE